MSSRTHYRGTDSVPAPNKYCLPPLMGPQVPNKPASGSYTISGSYSTGGPSVDLAKTPGPCRYNSTDPSIYLPRQPAFSMLGRHNLHRDSTQKPGPGAYNPEKVTVDKARAPAYSLGIRHSEFVTPLVVNVSDWISQMLKFYRVTFLWYGIKRKIHKRMCVNYILFCSFYHKEFAELNNSPSKYLKILFTQHKHKFKDHEKFKITKLFWEKSWAWER